MTRPVEWAAEKGQIKSASAHFSYGACASVAPCGWKGFPDAFRQSRPRSVNPGPDVGSLPSFLLLLEIEQVRRRLALLRRHQPAIGRVDEIKLVADFDPVVVCRTGIRSPGFVAANGLLVLRIGPRQQAVEHRQVVPEDVGIAFVQINA